MFNAMICYLSDYQQLSINRGHELLKILDPLKQRVQKIAIVALAALGVILAGYYIFKCYAFIAKDADISLLEGKIRPKIDFQNKVGSEPVAVEMDKKDEGKPKVKVHSSMPAKVMPAEIEIKKAVAQSPLGNQDVLHKYASDLAIHIIEFSFSLPSDNKNAVKIEELVHFLDEVSEKQIRDYCRSFHKQEYEKSLLKSFRESYKMLSELFQDEQFPMQKKIEIIDRLIGERDQCLTGIAGLLTDICSNVDEPKEMEAKLPWLISRYKLEVIKLAVTEVHCTYHFIVNYGLQLGLPDAVIKSAQADLHFKMYQPYFDRDRVHYVAKYRSSCTSAGCLDFLENFINADLPNRVAYRAYILAYLAGKVSEKQVEDKKAQRFIIAKHKAALQNDEKREAERHRKKFNGQSSAEADAEWEKFLGQIQLKKDPFIDEILYANYFYRRNPEDSEDNKLTSEAIKLFAQDFLKSINKINL